MDLVEVNGASGRHLLLVGRGCGGEEVFREDGAAEVIVWQLLSFVGELGRVEGFSFELSVDGILLNENESEILIELSIVKLATQPLYHNLSGPVNAARGLHLLV